MKKSKIPQHLFDLFRVGDAVELKDKDDEKRQILSAKLRIGSAVFVSEFSSTYLILEDSKTPGKRYLQVSYDGQLKCLGAFPDAIYPDVQACDVVMEILVEFWKLAKEATD